MKSNLLFLIYFSLMTLTVKAQTSVSDYLPKEVDYDITIPTPESILGHEVGEWHVTHDKLVQYMYAIAKSSNRASIKEYGRTNENRPLVTLYITSSENQQRLEELREKHVDFAMGKSDEISDHMPVVIYQGYSIHGNEASGSNASLLVAYYLAASNSGFVKSLLKNSVIILDPSLNPDGLNRFASWVNSHKSRLPESNSYDREHNESWPSGRTNHYWFDLNRDWLLLQNPESVGRVKLFHQWKPNVLTDHHEMGNNSTYFFQPGVPSRNNPLTPSSNFDMTGVIAKYHANALDSIGSLYYTKESFDDYYIGKGSTYPDVNGCIGILFEQASARGHLQESKNGDVPFSLGIKNHFNTSLSTLRAAKDLRIDLLNYQRQFYKSGLSDAGRDPIKGYVFGDSFDRGKVYHFLDLLSNHNIRVYKLKSKTKKGGKSFAPETSYIVPLNQNQYRLIKGVFEQRTTFQDSIFYDVSAWTLPLAFNLGFEQLTSTSEVASLQGELITNSFPEGKLKGTLDNPVAYTFRWDEYYAPRALMTLLENDIVAKVATKPFVSKVEGKKEKFDYGTIVIPMQLQHLRKDQILNTLGKIAKRDGIIVYSLSTGLSDDGVDIGSGSFKHIQQPKVAMIVGKGVSGYDAGEVWHLFDTRYEAGLVKIDVADFNRINLDNFNTLIMVGGSYSGLGVDKLKRWVIKGGNIVAMKGAVEWVNNNGIGKMVVKSTDDDNGDRKSYADKDNYEGAQNIGGSIFNTKVDLTHPLFYGYHNENIPMFKNNDLFINPTNNEYATPMVYTDEPLMSGYISSKNLDSIKESAAIIVNGKGKGTVISIVDNPNFRGYWYGANKLFMNAILFGGIIDSGAKQK